MIFQDKDTIAAIASPPGRGGIGIVRISGPKALNIAKLIFRRKKYKNSDSGENFKSHYLNLGEIFDPDSKEILDEVLLVFMPSPNSFTGEDVVEIQAHGSPVVLESIVKLSIKMGARLAEAGEFTKRAFINGKMDLSQAEGLIDLINAPSLAASKMALALLQGRLRAKVEELLEELLDLAAKIKAEIDFPEDVGELVEEEETELFLRESCLPKLKEWIKMGEEGARLREGLRLVIAGAPNVGKSSIMNSLLLKERSIVTDIAGTTRDTIEEELQLAGHSFVLADTAGIREDGDLVENMGMERAREKIREADLVLFVLDARKKIDEQDHLLEEEICRSPYIVILNKKDLLRDKEAVRLPESWKPEKIILGSAHTGEGLEELKSCLLELKKSSFGEHAALPKLRHKIAFENAYQAMNQVAEGFKTGQFRELIAIDLDLAIKELNKVLGIEIEDDLLDRIFSSFCIGK